MGSYVGAMGRWPPRGDPDPQLDRCGARTSPCLNTLSKPLLGSTFPGASPGVGGSSLVTVSGMDTGGSNKRPGSLGCGHQLSPAPAMPKGLRDACALPIGGFSHCRPWLWWDRHPVRSRPGTRCLVNLTSKCFRRARL